MTLNDWNIYIIGLTGGSGSGKTTVAKRLADFGAYVIDCDVIAHDIIKFEKPAYFEILEKISFDILNDNNEINRKKLGAIVFNDNNKLSLLNSITHFYIKKEVSIQIDEIKKIDAPIKYIIIDAPLLIEAELHTICNEVWVCYTNHETQIKRIMLRDGLSYDDAIKRVSLQMPFEQIKKYAHVCIDTSNGVKNVEEIWRCLCQRRKIDEK